MDDALFRLDMEDGSVTDWWYRRFVRGWSLFPRALCMMFVALGPITIVTAPLENMPFTSENWWWLIPILIVKLAYLVVVMPVVFDWIAHKVGFPLSGESTITSNS